DEAMMNHVLQRAVSDEWLAANTRVAASTVTDGVYNQVLESIKAGKDTADFTVNGRSLSIFRIYADENRVEAMYQEGYTFIVDRGGESLVVTNEGGIFL